MNYRFYLGEKISRPKKKMNNSNIMIYFFLKKTREKINSYQKLMEYIKSRVLNI